VAKLSTKDRNKLPASEFGIPDKRKFPLNDAAHVEDAARKVGYAQGADKKPLARKILSRARKYNLDTSGWKKVKVLAQEQVPPMSDGTSIGNAPPHTLAPYYEEDELMKRAKGLSNSNEAQTDVLTMAHNIASRIHAKYVADQKPPTGNQNCQLCVWCAEANFRGNNILPRPIYSPRDPAFDVCGEEIVMNPDRKQFSSFNELNDWIMAQPNARFYVHVKWKNGTGGHEFMLLTTNVPHILDPQQGVCSPITDIKTFGEYFGDIDYSDSYVCRLDDRQLNIILLNRMNAMSMLVPWDESKDIPYMREHGMLCDEDEQYLKDHEWVTSGEKPVQESSTDNHDYWEIDEEDGTFTTKLTNKLLFAMSKLYYYWASIPESSWNIKSIDMFDVGADDNWDLDVSAPEVWRDLLDETMIRTRGIIWVIEDFDKLPEDRKKIHEGSFTFNHEELINFLNDIHDTAKNVYETTPLLKVKNLPYKITTPEDRKALEDIQSVGILVMSVLKDWTNRYVPAKLKWVYQHGPYRELFTESFIDKSLIQESFMDEYNGSPTYKMRPAKESDLDFVYYSELETVEENKNDPKVQRYIKQDAKDSLGHTKIIVVDNDDVGVYQAYATNYWGVREGKRDWWYLAHIYIKPEYRSHGIGTEIIKNDISEHDKILLQVMKSNPRAKKLYESLGFVVSQENDHGGLVMRLDQTKTTQPKATPVQEGFVYTIQEQTWQVSRGNDFTYPFKCPDNMSVDEELMFEFISDIGFLNTISDDLVVPFCKKKGFEKEAEEALVRKANAQGWGDGDYTDALDVINDFDHTSYGELALYPPSFGELVSDHEAYIIFDSSCDKPSTHIRVNITLDGQKFRAQIVSPEQVGPITITYDHSDEMFSGTREMVVNRIGRDKFINACEKKIMQLLPAELITFLKTINRGDCYTSTIKGFSEIWFYNVDDLAEIYLRDDFPYEHPDAKKLTRDGDWEKKLQILEKNQIKNIAICVGDFDDRPIYFKTATGELVNSIDNKVIAKSWKEFKSKIKPYNETTHINHPQYIDFGEMISVLRKSEYGVAYHGKLITNPTGQDYNEKWHCLSPTEFINIGGGVCYDFVEWEAAYLRQYDVPFKKFHISYHNEIDKTDLGKDAATHAICVAIIDGNYLYIEGSSKKLAKEMGYIRAFNSIEDLLDFAVKHSVHDASRSKLIIIDYTDVTGLIGCNVFGYQNKIFSEGKIVRSGFVQEGAFQDIKNGVNPFSDNLVFHVTPDKYADGQVWKPRVPDYLDPYNPEETGFEDNTTPRICFSTSIEGCLNGITVNLPRHNPDQFDKLYVYIPEKPWKEYKHKTNKELVKNKLVYDANVTREVWITEPVRMKLYGVIRVDQVSNAKRKSVVPTSKGERDTRNYFTYKWHWVVKPRVLTKATKFDYSPEKVVDDLCNDLEKFKYGLIRNGRLMTGNVSDADYNKYWVFHSAQEVDEVGGGNCYDMVEYEANYLKSYGVTYKKYFMSFTTTNNKPINTHTICVVPYEGKFIYIEQAFKRVTDEWGHMRRRTFDTLNEIFQYVAECAADADNKKQINFGVWDYTNEKIDYGTPIQEFMKWIYTHAKMIYDGTAKPFKPTKEAYVPMKPSRFVLEGNDETITVGDIDLSEQDDDSDSDDDTTVEEKETTKTVTKKIETDDDDDESDYDVSNVDLGTFGSDTSDVQNEYDPKEIEILMKLMASEADAMNEYMDGAKDTNIDVLRRLYADIANEERFHMEQLLFAKSEITGEKYEPKDPDVKKEYEELLAMGMDEATAMSTAVDKFHIRGSVSEDDDDIDIDELKEDMTTVEMAMNFFSRNFDELMTVLESETYDPTKTSKAVNVFMESFYMEDVSGPAASDINRGNWNQGPKGIIGALKKALGFVLNMLGTIIRKFGNFLKKIKDIKKKYKTIHDVNGRTWKALFQDGVKFYFFNPKSASTGYIDADSLKKYSDIITHLTALCSKQVVGHYETSDISKDSLNELGALRFDNIQKGIAIIERTNLQQIKYVIDESTSQMLDKLCFGTNNSANVNGKMLSGKYDSATGEYRSFNVYNFLEDQSARWKKILEYENEVLDGFQNVKDQQLNTSAYRDAINGMKACIKGAKAFVNALSADLNQLMKINQTAIDEMKQHDAAKTPEAKKDYDAKQAEARARLADELNMFGPRSTPNPNV